MIINFSNKMIGSNGGYLQNSNSIYPVILRILGFSTENHILVGKYMICGDLTSLPQGLTGFSHCLDRNQSQFWIRFSIPFESKRSHPRETPRAIISAKVQDFNDSTTTTRVLATAGYWFCVSATPLGSDFRHFSPIFL